MNIILRVCAIHRHLCKNYPASVMTSEKYNYLVPSLRSVKPRILTRALEKVFTATKDLPDAEPVVVSLPPPEPEAYGPHADTTKSRVAFHSWAIPVLIRDLKSKEPVVVRQAINSMVDLVYNPEKSFEAIRYNIVEIVAGLMLHDDPNVREKCAIVLATIASQGIGREVIIQNEMVLANLKTMMLDDADEVRLQAVRALEIIARSLDGTLALNETHFLTLLMDAIEDEYKEDVLLLQLDVVEHLLEEERAIVGAVDVGGVSVLIRLMKHPRPDISTRAMACLARLLTSPAGKADAAATRFFTHCVVRCLRSEDVGVLTKAASVLMFHTINVDGREELLEMGVLPRLVQLAMNPYHKELKLAAIKVLTNLAEVPEGRKLLLNNHMTQLESMRGLEDESVARHANTLVKVIRWKP